MNSYFRRQLADYVEYHRDPWNCAFHVLGILSLFLGSVLPLSTWPVSALGVKTTVAVLAVLPVLIYWLVLDVVLGIGIAAAAVLLLLAAAAIVDHTAAGGMWSITAVLIVAGIGFQAVGHQVFEGRKPSLIDHPAHFLLGPMFVMLKLLIALGFRRDLAEVIEPASQAPSQSGVPVRP